MTHSDDQIERAGPLLSLAREWEQEAEELEIEIVPDFITDMVLRASTRAIQIKLAEQLHNCAKQLRERIG